MHYRSGVFESRAPILNVKGLKGEVIIRECHFEANKVFLDFTQPLNINQELVYPNHQLIVKKSGLLKGGLLLIQEHSQGVQIVDNTFVRNSGIRGIVEVRVESEYERGVFIFGNNFTHNTGYYRANCLNLRADWSESSQQSCSGFHIQHNSFLQNTNLPGEVAQVFLGCFYNMQLNKADDLDGATLFFVNGFKEPKGVGNPLSLKQNYSVGVNQLAEVDYRETVVRENYFV